MSIRKTIIVTVAIATAVAMFAPTFAGAVTIDELLVQIAALQAQLNALIAQQGGSTGGSTLANCAGVTFTRNMTVGATGSDVKCLQTILNQSATTRVAASGAGSPGGETSYFGPLTLAAVRIYQAEHGWTPANQVGPLTRQALNASLSGTPGQPSVIIPAGAGLSVQLAYDNPASGIVVAGQGLAPLVKLVFVNGDNAAVNVTNLKLNRIGVSADANLANVYLLQGATRLTDAATVASGLVTFNDASGLFSVPAGSSTTIIIASDICNTTDCTTIVGQTVGVQLASASNVTTNASSVKGTYPINGNLMTVSNATLAGAAFAAAASVSPTTNTSLTPQNNYTVWQDNLVISTRSVTMTRIAFRVIGSVRSGDLQNFRLNIDGVNVGSAVANVDKNGYVTFDLSSSPVTLQTGTRVVKVLADIISGSGYNFYLSIRVAADVNVVDSQYGVNVLPTLASGSFPLAASSNGVQTIASGTLTVVKATDSPSGTIILGASNATIAKYTFTAQGEPIKVTDLYVYIYDDTMTGTSTSSYFRNGALYANGVQVGSTTNIMNDASGTTGTHFSLGSAMIVNPGSPVTLEVKADIHEATTSSTAANNVQSGDSIYAVLVHSSTVAQDVNSLGTPTVSGTVSGNTLTVGTGSLTLSKYTAYSNQTVVPPVTNFKVGHFTLTSSSTEATNLNTIYVDLGTTNTVETNLYVKYGDQTSTIIASPSATAGGNSWSINYSLLAGATIDMQVFSDISSLAATTAYTAMMVSGTTASSATAVYASANSASTDTAAIGNKIAGQTITFSTGSINAVVDGTSPANQAVSGSQQVTAGRFKFTASNDTYTITELKFAIGTAAATAVVDTIATKKADSGAVTSLVLKDGSTVLKTVPFDNTNGWFYITGLNVAVAANTNKVLTADLILATPYTDGSTITTGRNLAVQLEYMKALNGSGVMHDAGGRSSTTVGTSSAAVTLSSSNSATTINSNSSGTSANTSSNFVYAYKAVPTFTVGSVSTKLATGSLSNLYTFTVSAPASGSVALKQLKFPITITDPNSTTVARLSVFRFYRGSTDITNVTSGQNAFIRKDATASNPDLTASAGTTTTITSSGTADVIFYPEEVIPAGTSITYTLKATPIGFECSSGTCDSASTYLAADTAPIGTSADTTAGNNQIYTYLAGDASYNTGKSNTAGQISLYSSANTATGADANLIWSDNSGKAHDYTIAASTGDWFNGYLIQNLPLDTIGVYAQ